MRLFYLYNMNSNNVKLSFQYWSDTLHSLNRKQITPKQDYLDEIFTIFTCPLEDLLALHVCCGIAMMTSLNAINGNISASLAICVGNSPVTGEFPTQKPVTRSFDAFFHLRLNKQLSKQSWGWWFETLSRPVWRHCNASVKAQWPLLLTWFNFNPSMDK